MSTKKEARKEPQLCMKVRVILIYTCGTATLRYLVPATTSTFWTCRRCFPALRWAILWPNLKWGTLCIINRKTYIQCNFFVNAFLNNTCIGSYLLVDGIYPDWTCFLGPISNPKTSSERNYTAAQASRRKDIERAFGCLQQKFNILNRPSQTPDLTLMNRVLRVCAILHNMVIVYFIYSLIILLSHISLGCRRKTQHR